MLLAAFCLAGAALLVALFALVAALDAREFWRALLDDYRGAQHATAPIVLPLATFNRQRPQPARSRHNGD